MIIGMAGDLLRGARAINMATPTHLTVAVLRHGLDQNPDCGSFILRTNPYAGDLAQRLADTVDADIKVVTDAKFAKDAWEFGPAAEM